MNVNTNISLLKDGTKIRHKEYEAIFPESIDCKITNKCNAECSYCHEESTPDGLSFDVTKAIELLKPLPYPTEIAIGGGNPAECINEINLMVKLLPSCVINVTLNAMHIEAAKKIKANAFGISLPKGMQYRANNLLMIPNVVVHLIVGVNTIADFSHSLFNYPRILVLGYKNYGRGITQNYDNRIKYWAKEIGGAFKIIEEYNINTVLAFDNFALEQLDIKRFFTKEKYESLYMGHDGDYTMYLDLVKMEYAKSSISEKYPIGDQTIKEMFASLKRITQ